MRLTLNRLFGKADKPQPVAQPSALRYKDIPEHSDKSLSPAAYPQQFGMAVQPQPARFFFRRYAAELHQLLDSIPLGEQDIDRLIMPLIVSIADNMNVLPASESHHHSGIGGLFIHSVQCAAAAVAAAENVPFDRDRTLEERYHNRNRWIVAAAVMALCHDAGKVFDMRIVREDGTQWKPVNESLWNWAEREAVQSFYIVWDQTRTHKRHELRSVRLMYERLLPAALINYLCEVCDDEILVAMEDAIVSGKGALADVLRAAETSSLATDAADRRHLGARFTDSSSPLLLPILTAIVELIRSTSWSVNREHGQVFVTTGGTFIHLSEKAAADVYDAACRLQAPYVPSTPEGLGRVLLETQLIEANPQETEPEMVPFWSISLGDSLGQISGCVKMADPLRIFPDGSIPQSLPLGQSPKEKSTEESSVRPLPAIGTFLAPKSDFISPASESVPASPAEQPKPKPDPAVSAGSSQSDGELISLFSKPIPRNQAKELVEKLLEEVSRQMLAGTGSLIGKVSRSEDGTLRASSVKIEALLRGAGFDQNLQKLVLSVCRHPTNMVIDLKGHNVVLKGLLYECKS